MPLELHVYRCKETNNGICGELWALGLFWLYTLEASRRTPAWPGHPCIPVGRYRVHLTMSPHLKMITPELWDVPGRSEIRIHIANWPSQLKGCTAVGETGSYDWVGHSEQAFKRLMDVLKGQEDIWITYHEGPVPTGKGVTADGGTQEGKAATAESAMVSDRLV